MAATKGRVVNTPISVGAQGYCLGHVLHNLATSTHPAPLQKKQCNSKGSPGHLINITANVFLFLLYIKAPSLLAKEDTRVSSVTSRSNWEIVAPEDLHLK